ncbi:hypothetical protein [Campylobacter geochelonis]|uniref:hypothetical protein n=1 Tax=Campylobacter geochelonis TaxID=1780362 RepID=UPI000770A6C8|nr:hypothetical protein [Campylobacter geochelonis]CZE47524.1 UDP-N-acetylmuramate--L-alanine ligase (UDP-N-acetylmuramoyl-L-alanine synthetase) [Campylobacter geochelonis]
MFFGFNKRGDIVPNFLYGSEQKTINLLFLTQFNSCVENELKIPLKYAKNGDLKDIFTKMVKALLMPKELKFSKANKLCITSNLILFSLFNSTKPPILASKPSLKAAKLASMFLNDGLVFNANELFRNFIFNKISRIHQDKKVYIENGIIYISVQDKPVVGILPAFKTFDIDDKKSYEKEIKLALNLSKKTPRIYIALPRQKGLKKHITVQACELDSANSCVKIVPYSITNKVFIKKFMDNNI